MAQMNDCAEKLEYEEAARFRDLIQSVKQVAQKQKITADDKLTVTWWRVQVTARMRWYRFFISAAESFSAGIIFI